MNQNQSNPDEFRNRCRASLSLPPEQFDEFYGSLKGLVSDAHLPATFRALVRAVASSFQTDRVLRPVMTGDEIRRRVVLSTRIIRELCGDLEWTIERALDELPHHLRARLDGSTPEPSKRRTWAPG